MSGIATAIAGSAVIGGVVASNSASKAANAQRDAANQASQTELEQYYQNREDMQPWRDSGNTALSQLMGQMGYLPAGYASNRDQIKERLLAGGYVKDSPELEAKIQSEWDREQSEIAAIRANPEFGTLSKNFSLADFTKDPGYDFRQQQGQRGVEASAAARGGVLSGAALKGLTRYNQDYASGEYQNAYNRFNNDRTQRFNRLASLAGVGQTAARDIAQQGAQVASNVGSNIMGAGNAQASSYVGQGNAISGTAQSLGNFAMNQYFMNQMKPGMTTAPAASTPAWTGGYGGELPVYG